MLRISLIVLLFTSIAFAKVSFNENDLIDVSVLLENILQVNNDSVSNYPELNEYWSEDKKNVSVNRRSPQGNVLSAVSILKFYRDLM